jgi:hypothetical protein
VRRREYRVRRGKGGGREVVGGWEAGEGWGGKGWRRGWGGRGEGVGINWGWVTLVSIFLKSTLSPLWGIGWPCCSSSCRNQGVGWQCCSSYHKIILGVQPGRFQLAALLL